MYRKLTILLLFLWVFSPSAEAAPRQDLTVIVQTSPGSDFQTSLAVSEKNGRLSRQILQSGKTTFRAEPDLPRAAIFVGSREFVFDSYSRLIETKSGRQLLLSPTLRRELEDLVTTVEQAHFGQPLHWNQTKKHFRRMSYAVVTDLETGKHFTVQRRAGSRHADVQPVTRKDTDTMKEIYQGEWSWRRRAVLVTVDGQRFAASMNGMPHGAGAIVGNGFPGHFCIHFAGSTTHLRRQIDPAHQLIILKASGTLREVLMKASPEQLVNMFMIALNERDVSLMRLLGNILSLPARPDDIRSLNLLRLNADVEPSDTFAATVPVHVSYLNHAGKTVKEHWEFHLFRSTPFERWKIAAIESDADREEPVDRPRR